MTLLKKMFLYFFSFFALLVNSPQVFAHCPLCTGAIGSGLLFTRYYGLPDSIVGLWLSAFVVSSALWANKLLKKEYIKFQGFFFVVIGLFLTIIPLYITGMIGYLYNSILGINELLLGMIAGSIIIYVALFLSAIVKKIKGNILFPYQTIVFTLVLLVSASLYFNFFR